MSLFNTAFGPRPASAKLMEVAFPGESVSNIMSLPAAEREAKIAALSTLEGSPEGLIQEFSEKYNAELDGMKYSNPELSRKRRAIQQRAAALMGTTSLDGEVAPEILAGMTEEIVLTPNETILEQQTYDALQSMRLAAGDQEAEIAELELFDPVGERAEREVHTAALLQIATDHGLFDERVPGAVIGDIGNMILFGPIPALSRTDSETMPWYEQIFAGGMGLQEDVEAFRALSREEQIAELPNVIAKLKDQATLWGDGQGNEVIRVKDINPSQPNNERVVRRGSNTDGFVNGLLWRQNLVPYIYGMDREEALAMSALDTVDSIFTIGGYTYGSAKAAGHIMKMQKIAGLRKGLEESFRANIRAKSRGEASPIGSSDDEIISEALPQAVNSELKDRDSMSVANVTLSNDEELEVFIETSGIDTSAFTQTQLLEIVQKSIDDWQKALPRRRKVIDVTVRNDTPGTGIYTPRLTMVVGTAKNEGYKDPNAMLRFAASLGIDDARIVTKHGDEVLQEAGETFTAASGKPKFDVRPKRDNDLDIAEQSLKDDPELVTAWDVRINPTEAEAKAMIANHGDVLKVLATKEGNVIMFPAGAATHLDAAEELGLSIRNLGRGFYDGSGNKGGARFRFDEPLESIDEFSGADDAAKFRLRRTEGSSEAVLTPEAQKAGRTLNEADQRLTLAKKDLDDHIRTRGDFFLRDQAGGSVAVRKRIENAQKEVNAAQKEYDEALADYEMVLQGPPGKVQVAKKRDGSYYLEVDVPLHVEGTWQPLNKQISATGFIGRLLLSNRAITSEEIFDLGTLASITQGAIINILRKDIVPRIRKLNKAERRFLAGQVADMRKNEEWVSENDLVEAFLTRHPDRVQRQDRMLEAYRAYREASDLDYSIRNAELYNRAQTRGFQTVRIDTEAFPGSEAGITIDWTNGRVHRVPPKALSEGRVYDARTGTMMDDYKPSEIGSDGAYIVSFGESQSLRLVTGERVRVNHVVVNRDSLTTRRLEPQQLPYKGGGSHIEYGPEVRTFVKQARRGVQEDTGQEYLLSPKTWIAGTRPSDVAEYVDRMNDARKQLQKYDAGRLTEIGLKRSLNQILRGPEALPSTDELIGWYNNWKYKRDGDGVIQFDPTEKLEILHNRQLPEAYDKKVTRIGVDEELSGHAQMLQSQGRLYYGKRGTQRLVGADNQELPILDPFNAMDRALSSASRIGGYAAYKQRAAQSFIATYGDILKPVTSNYTDAEYFVRQLWDDQSLFGFDDHFKPGASQVRVSQAKNELASLGRHLNWQPKAARDLRAGMLTLADKLDGWAQSSGKITPGWFRRAASDGYHWSLATDMGYGLRQMAFDTKLGLYNFAQIPLQITTALALSSIDSVGAIQAYSSYPIARLYAAGRFTPDELAEFLIAKRGSHQVEDIQEFVNMLDELKVGGYTNVVGQQLTGDLSMARVAGMENFSVAKESAHPVRKTANAVSKFASKRLEGGRRPFNEAEIFNRITAFQIAWRQIRKKSPDLDVKSQAFREQLYGLANDMAFNMTHNARAAWQAGPTSLMFQFFAYPARWLELIFPVGSRLTGLQKGRLIASQSALYGLNGTFILSLFNRKWKEENNQGSSPMFGDGENPERPDTLSGTLMEIGDRMMDVVQSATKNPMKGESALFDRGALDALAYIFTGQESRYTDTGEVYNFIFDYADAWMGNSRYGDTDPIDIFGGASVSILRDIMGDFSGVVESLMVELSSDPLGTNAKQEGDDFVPYSQAETFDLLRWLESSRTSQSAQKLGKNVSSLNNAAKMYSILNSGDLNSKSGKWVASDLDVADAVTQFFNISIQEQDILTAKMGFLQDRNKSIDDHVAVVNAINTKIAQSPPNSTEQRLWRRRKAMYYAAFVDPNLRPYVTQDSNRFPPSAMLDSVLQSTKKIEVTEAFAQKLDEAYEQNPQELEE